MLRWFLARALVALFLLAPMVAAAQLPKLPGAGAPEKAAPAPADRKSPEAVAEDLRKRLAAAEADLARLEAPGGLAAGAPPGTPDAELSGRRFLTQQLIRAYQRHQSELAGLGTAENKRAAADAQVREWKGFAEKPPYSMLLVDGLRQDLQREGLRIQGFEARQRILEGQMDALHARLRKFQEEVRQWQDAVERTRGDPVPAAEAAWKRDLALLGSRAVAASVAATEAALANNAKELEGRRIEFGFLERKLREAEQQVRFSAEDLETIKARIAARRAALQAELDSAVPAQIALDRALAETERRLTAERAALEKARSDLATERETLRAASARVEADRQADTGVLQKLNPAAALARRQARDAESAAKTRVAALEKAVAARAPAVVAYEREFELLSLKARNALVQVEVLGNMISSADVQSAFWELRYAGGGGEAANVSAMYDGSRELLARLQPMRDYIRHQLELTLSQIAEQQSGMVDASRSADAAHSRALADALSGREQVYLRGLAEIDELRLLLERWVAEFKGQAEKQGSAARTRYWWDKSLATARELWQFELFTVEDSIDVDGQKIAAVRGVTLGKVIFAVLIVVVGYLILSILARLLRRWAVRHWNVDVQQFDLVSKWLVALAMVVLVLVSLDVVKIPLTAFAFLGGALAIGAGFGMQNLVKNLISGIMVILERPFRLGDLVEVGGIRGTVTDINVRASTVRDINGIETLIPNSTFVEQNVTNWTYSSQRVRFSVKVGVAYGSPVRQVGELLADVAGRHGLVLKDPPPEVLFEDFAADALLFSLNYWLELKPGVISRVVASDLRFMIEKIFAENGIVVAYPQRDVHLDMARPLQVQVVHPEPSGQPLG